MNGILLLLAVVFLLCICAHTISDRFGMPALLLFMCLGMLFGSDGIFKIDFSDYQLTQDISSLALLFIMFFGGFCTKWTEARPVAVRSVLLSTVGVILTAVLTGLFCHFVLHTGLLEGLLIGSVLGSTDAASVFSILRSKNLNLKNQTASILELESGSNDPIAYMLTTVLLSLMLGDRSTNIAVLLFSQIFWAVVIGIAVAVGAVFLMNKFAFISSDFYTVFVIAGALLSFTLPQWLGGNGFLSVYLTGIIMGNQKIPEKKRLVQFFDSVTQLAQMILFFILGLLAFPHMLPQVLIPSLAIAIFLTLAARPAAVCLILKPFKASWNQCFLVAFSGLRGAASIAFAVTVVCADVSATMDIFHIVFFIALFSVAVQGSFLPLAAHKLHMIDNHADVHKTFNDYQDESSMTLMRFYIPEEHTWAGKKISDVHFPTGALALMIKRKEETLIPKGDTCILPGDNVIISVPGYSDCGNDVRLNELQINSKHPWNGKMIEELNLPDHFLIVLVKRNDKNIIPFGNTKLLAGDTVVYAVSS